MDEKGFLPRLAWFFFLTVAAQILIYGGAILALAWCIHKIWTS